MNEIKKKRKVGKECNLIDNIFVCVCCCYCCCHAPRASVTQVNLSVQIPRTFLRKKKIIMIIIIIIAAQRRSLKRLSEVSRYNRQGNRASNISTTMHCAVPTNSTTMPCTRCFLPCAFLQGSKVSSAFTL